MELSKGGKAPLSLPSGETRTFKGACQAAGAARIGFGEVHGTVLAARNLI